MRTPILLSAVVVAAMLSGCEDSKPAIDQTKPPDNNGNNLVDPACKEDEKLATLAAAYRKFRDDTGAWPLAASKWGQAWDVLPMPLGAGDTALFSLPSGTTACSEPGATKPCWAGPYLPSGSSMDNWRDCWNKPHLVAMIRPGRAGDAQPNGAVVLWSPGADGQDGAGCFEAQGSCPLNQFKLADGKPSIDGADDVITIVGPAQVTK